MCCVDSSRCVRVIVFISAVLNFTSYRCSFGRLWSQANYDPYFGNHSHSLLYIVILHNSLPYVHKLRCQTNMVSYVLFGCLYT